MIKMDFDSVPIRKTYQPTSADFIPQITFRIPHFRKLPTPNRSAVIIQNTKNNDE